MRKMKLIVFTIVMMLFVNVGFAGTIPLNTGYDYSNTGIYPFGTQDNYWIRIASYPTMPVGPSWAIQGWSGYAPPLNGPTGIPSQWINAFGNTWASPAGASVQDPKYAIYRKCFCLPHGYQQASIRGSVFTDDAIQIWLNSMTNPVLTTSPTNIAGTPYPLNYANQNAFRKGKNCMYVLVEDVGTATGFDLAANLTASGAIPMIATGSTMSFAPCSCDVGPGVPMMKVQVNEDEQIIKEIVKAAELRRVQKVAVPGTEIK
jgi:hypothetical protein